MKLNPVRWFWTSYLAAMLGGIAVSVMMLTGCANLGLEQKADALYGSYQIADSAAATLIQSAEVPDTQKEKIQTLHAQAKPAAELLYQSILEYKKLHDPVPLQSAVDQSTVPIQSFAQVTQ